ncbi:MAG TPA: hypothetical protein VFE58_20020 [Tepidisphaeraceae bacterium]|jgi:hypothetical protein|nr:hypothetical protein [Tepidisphaeraceae bacterium]
MDFTPSRELVLKKLHDCFPDAAIAREALAVLDTYGIENWHREKERVQLALLKISAGNLDKLRLRTNGARLDYRDTLMPAEFHEQSQASSNTPPQEMEVLRRRDREEYEKWLESGGAEARHYSSR